MHRYCFPSVSQLKLRLTGEGAVEGQRANATAMATASALLLFIGITVIAAPALHNTETAIVDLFLIFVGGGTHSP